MDVDKDENDSELVERLAELVQILSKDKTAIVIRKSDIAARIKEAQVRGKAYVTCSGKLRPDRKMGSVCPSKCRLQCFQRISQEDREALFTEFWSLSNRQAQWDYIAMNLFIEPKRKATTEDRVVISRRSNTRVYYFHMKRGIERVCKTMFLNTLGIGNNWLHTVSKKMQNYGYINEDQRGKFSRKPTVRNKWNRINLTSL